MIISIVARKGGSGKTTTAANLAAWLAGAGYVTIGIDLDPQGNLAAAFGVDPAGAGAAGWLNGARLASCLVSARRDRLSLVPADQSVIAAEIGGIASYSPLLAAAARLRADVDLIGADFVIIDSPTRGALQDLAILAADLIIIPAPCDFLGVNAAYESLEVARIWSGVLSSTERNAAAVWVLPTMATRTRSALAWLTRMIGDPDLPLWQRSGGFPFAAAVPLRAAVQRGVDLCDPVVSSAPHDPAAVIYADVGRSLLGYGAPCLVKFPEFRVDRNI